MSGGSQVRSSSSNAVPLQREFSIVVISPVATSGDPQGGVTVATDCSEWAKVRPGLVVHEGSG